MSNLIRAPRIFLDESKMRSTASATSRAVKRSGTRVTHVSAGVATVVVVFGVAACGGKSSSSAINATALDVHLSPIPRLNLPGYRRTGAVPQVSAANEDMTAVNIRPAGHSRRRRAHV